MISHTNGPWAYLDLGEVVMADNFEVLIATIEQHEDAEDIGNLIAAAPDLLAAAKTVLAGLNARIDASSPHSVPVFDGIADLHSAIARAEDSHV